VTASNLSLLASPECVVFPIRRKEARGCPLRATLGKRGRAESLMHHFVVGEVGHLLAESGHGSNES
jgi:hypothetical protein